MRNHASSGAEIVEDLLCLRQDVVVVIADIVVHTHVIWVEISGWRALVGSSSEVVTDSFWSLSRKRHGLMEGPLHALSESWAHLVSGSMACDDVQRWHFVELAVSLAEWVCEALVPPINITIFIDRCRQVAHIGIQMRQHVHSR